MNKTIPKLLRRTAFVLGVIGSLLSAEDTFAQKKKKKGQETPAAAPAAPDLKPLQTVQNLQRSHHCKSQDQRWPFQSSSN